VPVPRPPGVPRPAEVHRPSGSSIAPSGPV
jgi:hypothetical protein